MDNQPRSSKKARSDLDCYSDDPTHTSQSLLSGDAPRPRDIIVEGNQPRPPPEVIVAESEGIDDAVKESTEDRTTLNDLKEDLKATMAFANVLKRKLDVLYEKVFGEDAVDASADLETTLEIVGSISKEGATLQKVTECRFVPKG